MTQLSQHLIWMVCMALFYNHISFLLVHSIWTSFEYQSFSSVFIQRLLSVGHCLLWHVFNLNSSVSQLSECISGKMIILTQNDPKYILFFLTLADLCEEGWVPGYDYKCYKFGTERLSWEEARLDCQSIQDGDLVVFETEAEWQFVSELGAGSSWWLGE